jgi:hypothetical protein
VWDPGISVACAVISDASDTISPHFGAVFFEVNNVWFLRVSPQRTGIPKLVSPAYYSRQNFALQIQDKLALPQKWFSAIHLVW